MSGELSGSHNSKIYIIILKNTCMVKQEKMINYDNIMGLPEIVITEEDAERFEEYDKRPLTGKEKALLKEADEYYAEMCAKNGGMS